MVMELREIKHKRFAGSHRRHRYFALTQYLLSEACNRSTMSVAYLVYIEIDM